MIALLTFAQVLATALAGAALAWIFHALVLRAQREPLPASIPRAPGGLPWLGHALTFGQNPAAFLQAQRDVLGDTFALRLLGSDFVFTFSPDGLAALYGAREADASFAAATKALLGLKLPKEILDHSATPAFISRRLRSDLVAHYVEYAVVEARAVAAKLDAHGTDVFARAREIADRVSVAAWCGPRAAQDPYFSRINEAFRVLDPETFFKSPLQIVSTVLTRRLAEQRAIGAIARTLLDLHQHRPPSAPPEHLDDLFAMYRQESMASDEIVARRVAIEAFLLHTASVANMYAALAWTMIQLARDSGRQRIVRAALAAAGASAVQACAPLDPLIYESIRIAQRSLTLRLVQRPTSFRFHPSNDPVVLPKGMFLATLLTITNADDQAATGSNATAPTSARSDAAAPPPLRAFDASRYQPDGKLRSDKYPSERRYVVSTFGHGRHACPGEHFALSVCRAAVAELLREHEWSLPQDREDPLALIPPSSVGAVARTLAPVVLRAVPVSS